MMLCVRNVKMGFINMVIYHIFVINVLMILNIVVHVRFHQKFNYVVNNVMKDMSLSIKELNV